MGKFGKAGWVVAGIAVLAIILIAIPQTWAIYELYYGQDRWYELLSNRLNLPSNWSKVAAAMLALVTAFAWAPLAYVTFYLFRRPSWPKMAGLGLSWFIVYASSPFLMATLGASTCFSKDGTTDKWYVETSDHAIVLYDSGGFDAFGNRKKKATSEICARYALQAAGGYPSRVNYTSTTRFFSGGGAALIWYYRASNGEIELYDRPGYHPVIGERLQPVTKDIVEEVQRREAARTKTEAENARKQAELNERERVKNVIDAVRLSGGASFDCRKARTSVEIAICTDKILAALDKQLGEAYGSLVGRSTLAERQRMLDAQRRWINARAIECGYPGPVQLDDPQLEMTRQCLTDGISSRLMALQESDGSQKATAEAKPLPLESAPEQDEPDKQPTGSAYANPIPLFPSPFNLGVQSR